MVNFSERMRLTGTDGAAKWGMAPANTVHSLKRLLGKQFKDPAVQAELPRLPYSVTEAPDGRCQVNVQVRLGCGHTTCVIAARHFWEVGALIRDEGSGRGWLPRMSCL